MEEKARDELVSTLKAFRDKEIGATNSPVRLENGVVIQLKNWVRYDEKLDIDIVLPKRVKSPHEGQSLSNLESHFSRLVNEFNTILEEYGFEPPESYVYRVENKSRVTGEVHNYRFESTIPNPVSSED